MNRIFKFFLLGAAATTFSCASILSKSEYPVVVSSQPSHVKFSVERINDGKKIFDGETPTTVVLPAGNGFFQGSHYKITFYDQNGKVIKSVNLNPNLDPWYVGNILFGGVIGLLIVDPLTGAMWKLPDEVSVDLNIPEEKVSTIYFGKKEVKVISYNDLPENIKKKLVPLN